MGGDDDEDNASDTGSMVFSVEEVGKLVFFGVVLSILSTICCSSTEM